MTVKHTTTSKWPKENQRKYLRSTLPHGPLHVKDWLKDLKVEKFLENLSITSNVKQAQPFIRFIIFYKDFIPKLSNN